jgi:hypothetical protein
MALIRHKPDSPEAINKEERGFIPLPVLESTIKTHVKAYRLEASVVRSKFRTR